MTHTFTVEDFKIRLDRYLAKQLPEISRSAIQRDIEAGKVTVDGKVITMTHFAVRLGNKIVFHPSEKKSEGLEATNTPLKVLYNDHGLLIIDKPAGLTVHPGAGFKGETLASALLYHFSAPPKADGSDFGGKGMEVVGEEHRPGIVHRLDKDTSGVILVAKDQAMYEFLKDAFADHKIKKEYIALVAGRIEKPHGFIDTPIGRSKSDFRKYTAKNPVSAKQSLTEYQVLEYLRPNSNYNESNNYGGTGVDGYTLIMVKLHSGRTHQIRVHLSSIGHPLVGDPLYGNKTTERKDLHRQFLHAKRIEVQLPASPDGSQGGPDKTWIEAESEFPQDLKRVLTELHSKKVNEL